MAAATAENLLAPAVRFSAVGQARPGGNHAVGYARDGRAFIRNAYSNKEKPWRDEVARAANDAMAGRPLFDGPLLLRVTFVRLRPRYHYRTNGDLSKPGLAARWPIQKPDTTKLLRGLEDALTGIVWRDDAQVVQVTARKVWGEPARADVEVVEL